MVALLVGGAVWFVMASVLGELDHRPIVPLDQAQVGDRAWAEGTLDGPEVIRYGPQKGKNTPRKLLDPGPKTLGFEDANGGRVWVLHAVDLEYSHGDHTFSEQRAETRVDLSRMAVLGDVVAPGELELRAKPDAAGLVELQGIVRSMLASMRLLERVAQCAWAFGGFLIGVGLFLSVGRKSSVPHGYLYNLWWVDLFSVPAFALSWGLGTHALVSLWQPAVGAVAGLAMGALFTWRVGSGLISGFNSWRNLPHWTAYWPNEALEGCDPMHIWRSARLQGELGTAYAWDQGTLLSPQSVVLLEQEGQPMGIWKLDRDWVQADLEAVSMGGKPGDRV